MRALVHTLTTAGRGVGALLEFNCASVSILVQPAQSVASSACVRVLAPVQPMLNCPLDVVKTRLMAQTVLAGALPKYSGMMSTMGIIVKEEVSLPQPLHSSLPGRLDVHGAQSQGEGVVS